MRNVYAGAIAVLLVILALAAVVGGGVTSFMRRLAAGAAQSINKAHGQDAEAATRTEQDRARLGEIEKSLQLDNSMQAPTGAPRSSDQVLDELRRRGEVIE